MTRVDAKIETCSCQVCRSDLAYIIPCLKEPANDVENFDRPIGDFLDEGWTLREIVDGYRRVSSPATTECPAMVEMPPVPFVM